MSAGLFKGILWDLYTQRFCEESGRELTIAKNERIGDIQMRSHIDSDNTYEKSEYAL